jgi:choline dehydrogenase-like flavoprotein
VVASRLSSYLPDKKVLLVEAGPSDYNDQKVLQLKEWLSLLGDADYDFDYPTTEQPMGITSPCLSRPSIGSLF